MSDAFIPYGRQWVDDDDIDRVVEVLRSDFLTTGPAVQQFEQRIAGLADARFGVAVNSGTAALHAAYFAAGIGPGDEIITSPLTFAATANAARYLGADVRFVDIDVQTGNLDPAKLEAAIGERTKLVVPVDYAGHPAEYDAIGEVANEHGLAVIADAAHSFGATYRGRSVGSLADASTLSFHPVKPLTTAEGGAVVTDNAEWAQQCREFRSHGVVRDPARLQHADGPWSYEMTALGYNYRLSDLHAALGLSQSEKLDGFLARRRFIAVTYLKEFADLPGVQLPHVADHVEPGWHLFVIRVADAEKRRPLFEELRRRGVGVQVHYVPVYWHPYYRQLGFEPGLCPVAEQFYAGAISLPIFPAMTDADVDQVLDRVRQAVTAVGL